MTKISVSDEDIEHVERIFRFAFNDEQKKLIRYWGSADIQACPGSGKTTTLAAKLIILSQKIPKSSLGGICVITHTNTAVEEIKSKLGNYGRFYQQYPNHFGTIQSFVDKYIAIPFYRHLYKRNPSIIEQWEYNNLMRESYPIKVDGTISYLDNNNVSLGDLTFNKFDFSVSTNLNSQEKWRLKKLKPDTMKKYYEKILSAKNKLLEDGWLKYEEAYAFAFRHIREHPNFVEFIKRRFPIVFVDEMQDMEEHQQEIIDVLFRPGNILQRIGDTNQSIYAEDKPDPSSDWNPIPQAELSLQHSNRISDHLVEIVKDICWKPQKMTGWTNASPVRPILIICNSNNIVKVKEVFAQIVIENGLHKKGVIKVIGARRSNSRLNINSYWRDYNKKYVSNTFPNLHFFLAECHSKILSVTNVKDIREMFLKLFCHCLRLNNVRNPLSNFYFTPHSFLNYLEQTGNIEKIEKINRAISDWLLKLRKGEDIRAFVKQYISLILIFFKKEMNAELNNYLNSTTVHESDEEKENIAFRYSHQGETVELIFDTIHGVKGQTHAATLYLETYNRAFDIGGKILDFIVSNNNEKERIKKKDKASYKRLPHAYVALTRATDFLAICVDITRYSVAHRAFFENEANGWNVKYVDVKDGLI